MASSTSALLLLLFLVLASTEMGPTTVAEARTCISQSHNFRGACISSTNCASVCRTENFLNGDCKTRGLTRKCYCVKQCS